MCYMVHLSTDCPEDLSLRNCDLVRFERASTAKGPPCPTVLTHEHRWFVGSRSGCSCTFRHLHHASVALGFGEPEDWCPEEEEPLAATRRLYDILKELVQSGHQIELVDCWSGDEDVEPVRLDVSVSEVPATHFRLFEGYVFSLRP